jgi:hypothetical protein
MKRMLGLQVCFMQQKILERHDTSAAWEEAEQNSGNE